MPIGSTRRRGGLGPRLAMGPGCRWGTSSLDKVRPRGPAHGPTRRGPADRQTRAYTLTPAHSSCIPTPPHGSICTCVCTQRLSTHSGAHTHPHAWLPAVSEGPVQGPAPSQARPAPDPPPGLEVPRASQSPLAQRTVGAVTQGHLQCALKVSSCPGLSHSHHHGRPRPSRVSSSGLLTYLAQRLSFPSPPLSARVRQDSASPRHRTG